MATLKLFAVVFQLFFTGRVLSEDTCRIVEFTEPEAGSYLEHHVIQSTVVANNDQCKINCYVEKNCLSYNLEMLGSGDKFICELSDSDHYQHPEHMVSKKGFSYHPTAKLCDGLPCPPAASCLHDQQGNLRCVCPAHWLKTDICEKDTDECSSGSHDCSDEAYCSDTLGSFTCTCKPGFSGDGKTCTNINECVTGSNKCHVNATCTDTEGSYNCTCNDDTIGDGILCIGFPFHWKLDGSDPWVSLYNGAVYKEVDGKKALYLDGNQRSYAETSAIPIQTISFSILCWIKVLSLPEYGRPVHIYSDWSTPHQFRFFVYHGKLYANLRRSHSSMFKIVLFSGGNIIVNEWMHVAFTWSRENRVGKLYINATQEGEESAWPPEDQLDLQPNHHTVFDIGLKRDSLYNPTFHGYLRDLMVIDRAISEDELNTIFAWSKN